MSINWNKRSWKPKWKHKKSSQTKRTKMRKKRNRHLTHGLNICQITEINMRIFDIYSAVNIRLHSLIVDVDVYDGGQPAFILWRNWRYHSDLLPQPMNPIVFANILEYKDCGGNIIGFSINHRSGLVIQTKNTAQRNLLRLKLGNCLPIAPILARWWTWSCLTCFPWHSLGNSAIRNQRNNLQASCYAILNFQSIDVSWETTTSCESNVHSARAQRN